MTFRAVVFDFDGSILDTETPILTAWQETFEAHGCPPLTQDEWAMAVGTVGGLDMAALLLERALGTVDEAAVHQRRRARVHELLLAEVVRPGVERWLDDARELGLGLAVASSSPRSWVGSHLERLGLVDRFVHLSCYGDGIPAKPAPDVYLHACAALGVEPSEALAVEDSPHGVAAAKAAGLRCVAVPNEVTRGLELSAADLVVDSLEELPLAEALDRLALSG